MIEFAGEFATQLTLSFYFNNNVLGVRKGSALSRGLVDIVCMLPYSRDTKEYCKIVGSNCYPKWYVLFFFGFWFFSVRDACITSHVHTT